MSDQRIKAFQKIVWDFYHLHGRTFPWRQTNNPYHIFVSEVMLQQTQTYRVVEKYLSFIDMFAEWSQLAMAPTRDVIAAWQGLGYNRRALYLQESAKIITNDFKSHLPANLELLDSLPGIAFNIPTIFIETNIRAVFIHEFFADQEKVDDKDILPLVEQSVDQQNPREWYYALMDYGVMLKKAFKNPARKSLQYSKQSAFEGSDRQIRGMILRALIHYPLATEEEIKSMIPRESSRINKNLENLLKEGLIKKSSDSFHL
jgi:A/G-specific adenine glycosylase